MHITSTTSLSVEVEFPLYVLSAVVADIQGLGAAGAGLVAAGREGDVVRTLQTNLTKVLLLQILVSGITCVITWDKM